MIELKDRATGQPQIRFVESSSALLKRWYIVERMAMQALAGWLPAVETQELKLLIAKHVWSSAVSADALRTRITQLRYPRRDVDRDWDQGLVRLMEAVLNAPDELCLISGLYQVVRTELQIAYNEGMVNSDRLADAPSLQLLRELVSQNQKQLDEMLPLLEAALARSGGNSRTAEWVRHIDHCAQSAGGISGDRELHSSPAAASLLERPFQRPVAARRDPRYARRCEMMGHHWRYFEVKGEGMTWLTAALLHFNEMWAAEMAAAQLFMHRDAPWALLLDAARWCYDEARHCQMGITRFESAGLSVFHDVPAPDTVTFDSFEPGQTRERLLAVHGFERSGVLSGAKQEASNWHLQRGDLQGSRHFDFDWADESIHLQYGVSWLKHLYGEDVLDAKLDERIKAAIAIRENKVASMAETERPLVRDNFQHLCAKLQIEFNATF